MSEEALSLAHAIVQTLEEKKGEDILLLDLLGVCAFTDYFVICTGGSERTLQALAEEVLHRVKVHASPDLPRTEGEASSGWVLLDYGDVILHLFAPQARAYYRLEDLWRAGKVLLRLQ
ncbi:MAG: ribosome silencing factor [Chloroflexota bacterium]